jgi:hypothetical protein
MTLKFVIFEKDGKNRYAKFGDGFTVKTAKEYIGYFGYRGIYAGASTEKTMDMIYNTGAEYVSGDTMRIRFVA